MNESEHFTGSMGLGSLLEAINVPDIMTPDQFFGRVGASGELSGEQRLKQAILEDAIACYQMRGKEVCEATALAKRRLKHYAEALEWIEGGAALISFDDCCEALGWNPEWIRAGIKRGAMGRMPNHAQSSRDSKIGVPLHRGRHPASRRHTSAFAPLTGHQVIMDGLFQEVAE